MLTRVLAVACCVLLLAACSADDWRDLADQAGGESATEEPLDLDLEQDEADIQHSKLSDTIEEALPSVVNVKVTSVAQGGVVGRGEGSGVVIDSSGVILTNYHVVACAASVRVVFTDGRDAAEGTVVGAVPERDLAILKVDATGLEEVPIGSSDALKLGDDVIAIGFPLGLGGVTVTRGILSGEGRSIRAQGPSGEVESLEGLLQTDAAINPGNSGGALIDRAGRLVGINTAVAGEAENIGFAIAVDDALPIVEEILNEPQDRQAWLGVSLDTVDSPALAQELGLPSDTQGALVVGVVPDSPAEESGLEEGGVVVEADGRAIASADELVELLSSLDPGAEIGLRVVTPGGTQTVSATLAQRPFDFEALC